MGFAGGPMVKNPSANAENMNLTPDRRRSHVPWSNYAPAQKLLSVCSRACMPHSYQVHMPRYDRKRSRRNERTLQQGVSPLTTTRENPHTAKKTQDSQKLIRKTVGSANLQRRQKKLTFFTQNLTLYRRAQTLEHVKLNPHPGLGILFYNSRITASETYWVG